jgi:hypothetical protein
MPSPRNPSARVLANRQARIEMSYQALDTLTRAMADGLLQLGEHVLEDASGRAPRDPAAAEARGIPMMGDTGGLQVWANGKRVGGTWAKRPKGGKVPQGQAVLFVGFDSRLSHLLELGTVKMRARPFLTPALMANLADTEPYVRGAISRYAATAGERTAKGLQIKARIAESRAKAGSG